MIEYTFDTGSLEYFLMIFVRIATFMFSAPFFSMPNTPGRVKIGLSLMMSVLLFQILPKGAPEYATVTEYAIIVLKEGITGLLIGFAANICNSIVLFAGRIMDIDIGLSMATLFDPISNETTSITGVLYYYLILMLLIVTDMHQFVLRAFVDSYQLIPVNGMDPGWGYLYQAFVGYMTDYLVIGFRIALPVFACILILNVVLGILARVAPQMNMFAVGIQIKIAVGLFVLIATVPLLPIVANYISGEMKKMIVLMIKGMSG